jgi:hypothetical protein
MITIAKINIQAVISHVIKNFLVLYVMLLLFPGDYSSYRTRVYATIKITLSIELLLFYFLGIQTDNLISVKSVVIDQ